MTDLVSCTRCPAFAEWVTAFRGAARQMPEGWSTVTISGRPVHNVVLCPECVEQVRVVVETRTAVAS
jgi:hypothetical protein